MISARPNSLLSAMKVPGGPHTRSDPPLSKVNTPPLAPSSSSEPADTHVNAMTCFLLCSTAMPTRTMMSIFMTLSHCA